MENPDFADGPAIDEDHARNLLSAFSAMANHPSEENLARLQTFYAPDLRFEDPGQIYESWDENGGAKLGHGSGGEVLLRAA